MPIYFKDNFFNSGPTEIMDEDGTVIGHVDLRSMFGASLEVFDRDGATLFQGKFPLFSRRWSVLGQGEREAGELRQRLAFLSKRFEYDSFGRGVFEIASPAFSDLYEITDEAGNMAAGFRKVSGWVLPSAYRLETYTSSVGEMEWVCVILGMNAIQKAARTSN
ncbi:MULTISPECIES: hypothetical protein [Paenibacillus]|uniref:hypothetical protein n=1 Tax=Paenibacillus TaxID=44249 RepID=UPI00038F587F|nr:MULTISPECIES: hypothetical protein [Paenibacillus]CDN41983.1 Conserved domain protein [Paenibacillus sp. P22]